MSARAYNWIVLALCGVVLVPAVSLNMLIIWNNYKFDKAALASAWQQETRGVTYAPPISDNRPFKTLRLHDRLPGINALVFGSSTMMSITSRMFPEPVRAYNFAQSGNPLASVAAEAEYVLGRWDSQIRYLVIPIDWALGFPYARGPAGPVDLSLAARAQGAGRDFAFVTQLRDALSGPRMRDLWTIVRDVLRARNMLAAIRQFFLEPAGDPYRCPDGTPARDYDTIFRGKCVGFRYDGSATFADQKRIEAEEAALRLAAATASGSQYARALRDGGGEPAPELLEALSSIARRAATHGGRAIFLLPPLMPGMELGLLASAHSGAALVRTKAALAEWSLREGVTVLDAAASERYGCTATEFIDPHHALPACYEKVLARLWPLHRATGMQTAAGG